MRKAIVSKFTGLKHGIAQFEEIGEVKFHAWGCGYEEFESGPAITQRPLLNGLVGR